METIKIKYEGIKKASDLMQASTIKDWDISPHKRYYVFTRAGHTVGVPTCSSDTFEQIRRNAEDSMPKL